MIAKTKRNINLPLKLKQVYLQNASKFYYKIRAALRI